MKETNTKNTNSILMVTSEAVPYAKSGGLADAVTALARELDIQGHDVRMVLPRYYFIRKERLQRHPSPITVRVGGVSLTLDLYEARLPLSSVVVYFVDYEECFGRDGIYGDRNGPYQDNLRRFAVLCLAALAIPDSVGWAPDVVHAHDWPGGLVPVRARGNPDAPSSARPATVFSIHNLGYQGQFPIAQLPATGFDWTELSGTGLLHHGSLNLLHCGIEAADMVTTVSPQYAQEIQTPRYGFGLDRTLAGRSDSLVGILNGVDYETWSPSNDPFLETPYTIETAALKGRTKNQLQKEMGLPVKNDVPLIGIVSRLASQKGFEELTSPGYGALPAILSELDAQVVILGSGEERYEHELLNLAARFENLATRIGFDDRLAHMIEAGSDFFLMPSRYEPCGLNQLYSLAYGAIPIVTRTGGLVDTIEPVSADGGTGFLIDHACPSAIIDSVSEAVTLWHSNPSRIDSIRRDGMKQRYLWSDSVRAYEEVYQRAIETAGSPSSRK